MSEANSTSEQEREQRLNERNRQLEAELAAEQNASAQLQRIVRDQNAEIERLKSALAAALKTSSTSSKPPSSDIVKRKRPATPGSPRKIGAQPGHPLHERAPFKPDEINGGFFDHTLSYCPDCQGPVSLSPGAKIVVQQMDLAPLPVRLEEHRAHCYGCPKCNKHHAAALPTHIEKGGLCGPYLTSSCFPWSSG
jgi:transposase